MTKKTKGITLKYFDITQIKRDATICVIGKRGSGKSCFVRCMMYHNQNIPRGIVISGSEEHNPFYRDFIPASFIFESYDSEILARVIERQKKQVAKEGKTPQNNTFIIMDDVLAEPNVWKNDVSLRDVFFNGRHFGVLLILILQDAIALRPSLRTNFDYVFIFRDNSKENIKKLYNNFGGAVPDLKTFEAIMQQGTADNHCVVIDNKSLSSNIEDCVFLYKACLHNDTFRVGSAAYWKAHDEAYKGNVNTDEDADGNDESPKDRVKIVVRSKNDK
jgi:energy-coupling factor transporter ATP-binding protein EcfA2